MTVRVHYDGGISYWDRRVFEYGGDIFVIDNVTSPTATDLSIRYNLPKGALIDTYTNCYKAIGQYSNVWLSVFNSYPSGFNSISSSNNKYAQNESDSMTTSFLKFSIKKQASDNGVFVSVIQPKNYSINTIPLYRASQNTTAANVIQVNDPLNGFTRFEFVNKGIFVQRGTVTIGNFSTDALWGVIDISNNNGNIIGGKLYEVTMASNNGNPINISNQNETTLP